MSGATSVPTARMNRLFRGGIAAELWLAHSCCYIRLRELERELVG
jgi:hypothetical protein